MKKQKKPAQFIPPEGIQYASMGAALSAAMEEVEERAWEHYMNWMDDEMAKLIDPDIFIAAHVTGDEKVRARVMEYMARERIYFNFHANTGTTDLMRGDAVIATYDPPKIRFETIDLRNEAKP